jgi:hypothetical protein
MTRRKMITSKNSFETYLALIEPALDYPLHEWQKLVLRYIYEGKDNIYPVYMYGDCLDKAILRQAAELLKEQMNKENNND